MITDRDKEDAENIAGLYAPYDCDEMAAGYVSTIRAESAEQARKEAAERAVDFLKKEWYWFNDDACYANELRTAILGDSAPVSTDSEKLAIAVKALESASMSLAFYDGDYGTLSLVRQALKEIQG